MVNLWKYFFTRLPPDCVLKAQFEVRTSNGAGLRLSSISVALQEVVALQHEVVISKLVCLFMREQSLMCYFVRPVSAACRL